MRYRLFALFVLLFCSLAAPLSAFAEDPYPESLQILPVDQLVGERLTYDVSFLWFDRLAIGTISLTRGEQPGTYVAELEARTRGFAAMVTRDRVEKYRTIMDIGPNGLLRPLVYSSHTLKGKGKRQREKITSYTFDYAKRQVKYQKIKNNAIRADEMIPLESEGPVYDILSAFYNLRLGAFGPLDQKKIALPTLHRKGVEEIIVAPIARAGEDNHFFAKDELLCKVLVDPEIFGTDGNDLLISFDENSQPQKAVVKNVIGLGDVKGVLRHAEHHLAMLD